jgi:hypothetical protein
MLAYLLYPNDDEISYLKKPGLSENNLGNAIGNILGQACTWVLICANFVPISLLVTLETVKLF